MIQSKPPVTRWCNNLSLAGKQPVRIKLPLTQIQYLHEVPGFRSVGHIYRSGITIYEDEMNRKVICFQLEL